MPLKTALRRSETPPALSHWTVRAIAVVCVSTQTGVWNIECTVGKEEGFSLGFGKLHCICSVGETMPYPVAQNKGLDLVVQSILD